MGLSSSIKSSPAGFAEYYHLRKVGLENLKEAFIRLDFDHRTTNEGGVLTITVTDSGKGFIPAGSENAEEKGARRLNYYGRGLSLIESICESLEVMEPGNKVRVKFRWVYGD